MPFEVYKHLKLNVYSTSREVQGLSLRLNCSFTNNVIICRRFIVKFIFQSMSKPWLIIGRVAYLYTDSFLVISGLLAAYTLSKFSPVKSVIARYIRLVRKPIHNSVYKQNVLVGFLHYRRYKYYPIYILKLFNFLSFPS